MAGNPHSIIIRHHERFTPLGIVMAQEMVWMDLEMTGLDIEVESIIEIATVITDADLNIIATGPNLAIKVNQELIDGMDD